MISRNRDPLEIVVGGRALGVALLVVCLLCIATRATPEAAGWGWALRVAGVTVLVGVAPGLMTILAWHPRHEFSLVEWLGLGVASSLAMLHLLTIAAVTLHQPPSRIIAVLGVVMAIHLGMTRRSAPGGVAVRFGAGDVALLMVVGGIGVFLYALGSPFVDSQEDRVHIAIVQRLSRLTAPSIANTYLSPGAYTYPFPGTHYAMALMSRIGNVEPIFLYHKLRAFWGIAAIVLVWASARVIFENGRMALAVGLVAAAFVANGTFAAWSQLAPFSHAADLAMGVLLPAQLLLVFSYLRANERGEARFFLAAAVCMALMLLMAHPREIVQVLVYLAAFSITLIAIRGPRLLLRRAAILLLLSTSVLVVYRLWYQVAVGTVDTIISQRRERLTNLFAENSWAALFGQPLPLLEDYMPASVLTFRWWVPIVLLASPIVLYLLRGRPLALFVASGIAAYLAIMRVPLLAMTYAYATYWEILYAPVRKIAFFTHLLAGVSLYLVAVWLARYGYVALVVGALLAAGALIELFERIGPAAAVRADLFFVPVLIVYGLALTAMWRREPPAEPARWPDEPRPRWALAFALMLIAIVPATWQAESAIVKLPLRNRQPTPAALLASIKCGDDNEYCAPSPALIQFARDRIPVESIFAVDYRQAYEPSMFLPQQVDVWSGAIEGLVEPELTFPGYFKHLARARAASLDQPLFNDAESREERAAFVRDLRITHVLVNPRLHGMMTGVLARHRDLFVPLYDDGAWALYEVSQRSGG